MRIRMLPAALGLAVGLTLAGCGSSDSNTLPVRDDPPEVAQTPGSSATLPSDWPAGVPEPETLTRVNAIALDAAEGRTWSATYQGPGDATAVYDQLTNDLQANGFTSDGGLGGTGDGGISTWTKGSMRVQVTVLTENGQVGANITALDQGT